MERNIRIIHNLKEKSIRTMIRKLDEIHNLKREAPFIKLDTPRFWGYRRFFIVRPDILRSSDGMFYSNLLPKIQEVWYSKDKTFERPMLRHNRVFGYIWRLEKEAQGLKKLSEEQWKSLDLREQDEFIKIAYYHKYTGDVYYRWVFRYPWKYELKTKKFYITQEQIYDSELDSEERKLSHRLWKTGLAKKLDHPSNKYKKRYKRQKFDVSGVD